MDIQITNSSQAEYFSKWLIKHPEMRQFVQVSKGVVSFPDAAAQDLVNFMAVDEPKSTALKSIARQITVETGGQITNPYNLPAAQQVLQQAPSIPTSTAAVPDALPVTAPTSAPVNPEALAGVQQRLAALQPETRGLTALSDAPVASRLAAANQAIGVTPQTSELGALVRSGVITAEEAADPMVRRSLANRGLLSAGQAELVPGMGSTTGNAITREGIAAGRAFNPQTFVQGAFGNPSEAAAAQMLSTPQAQIEALANAGGAFNPGLTGAVESTAAKALVPAVEQGAAKALTREAALGQLKSLGNLNAIGQPKLLGKILTPNAAKAGLSGAEEAALQSLMSGGDAAAAKVAATQAGKAGLFQVGGLLGPRSVGQGLAWGLGGQLASSGLRGILGGERDASTFLGAHGQWDNAAEDALSWGGTGAGFGSAFGPIGTAVGGIGGLVLGGLHGFFTGEDSQPKQIRDYLTRLQSFGNKDSLYGRLTGMGLSTTAATQILQQIATMATGAKSKAEVEQLVQSILPNVPALAAQEQAYKLQQGTQAANSKYFAQYVMPQFQDQLNTYRNDAKTYASAMQAAVPSFKNPALGNIFAAQALQSPVAADRYISAVTGQLAALQAMQPTQTQAYYPNIFGNTTPINPAQPIIPQQQMMSSGLLAPLG